MIGNLLGMPSAQQIKLKLIIRAVCAALIIFPLQANAHWWYSENCCSERDCHEALPEEVEFRLDGWYVTTTKETIPFDDPRIQTSLDDKFHVCIYMDNKRYGLQRRTRCLYVPEARS